MRNFALLTAVGIAVASGASLLEQRIDEAVRSARSLAPALVGIQVVQLRSGKLLYARNADKLMTPASNTKLFSTALALSRLGPDFRLTTTVLADNGPDSNGVVNGGLTLYGGGDPSMSDRLIPYDVKSKPTDALAAMDALATTVFNKGVRVVAGDITGDDTAYPFEPYPPGWAEDDTVWEYGAPVSALTFNHGTLHVQVQHGTNAGDPASITIKPPVEYFAIENRLRTVDGEQKIRLERSSGSRELRLSGTVSLRKNGVAEDVAVDDAALFAATAFYEALLRQGVVVRGRPLARHRELTEEPRAPAGRLLAERKSPPLEELLRVTDKISQNLWAELMLRAVAKARTGDGSRKAGLEEMKAFLTEAGIQPDTYVFEDGSGLSRMTLLTPATIERLLRYMALSPVGEHWKTLLPLGAVDGSLEKRFNGNAAAHAIAAKTGSLSHVNALSGYADSGTYGELAFSILVNNTSAPAAEVRAAIDRIALALLD